MDTSPSYMLWLKARSAMELGMTTATRNGSAGGMAVACGAGASVATTSGGGACVGVAAGAQAARSTAAVRSRVIRNEDFLIFFPPQGLSMDRRLDDE
jgi:hypothetical protein